MARWSLEVLSTQGSDRDRWLEYVEALPAHGKDIYYLPEYAALSEGEFHDPVFLFRFGDRNNGVMMVAAKRTVDGLSFYRSMSPSPSASYYDIATPYGYGGPAVQCNDIAQRGDLFLGFRDALQKYCVSNGIVAEFLRLHPLMQNHNLFGQDPGLYEKNCTVWIDLAQSECQILESMKNDPRRSIKIARNKGVEITLSDLNPEHIKEFHRLYTRTMERLKALPMYYFSFDYFQELVARLKDHIALFIATWNGKAISAYLFFRCGRYFDLHLAGSDPDH